MRARLHSDDISISFGQFRHSQGLLHPGEEVATLAQRSSKQATLRIEQIEPETLWRNNAIGRNDNADRGRGADGQRPTLAGNRAGTRVRRRPIADGREPGNSVEHGPARGVSRQQPLQAVVYIAEGRQLRRTHVQKFSSRRSQVRSRMSNMPVPEAIERLQTERPRNWRCRYSPNESHCAARLKISRRLRSSQNSLAGQ